MAASASEGSAGGNRPLTAEADLEIAQVSFLSLRTQVTSLGLGLAKAKADNSLAEEKLVEANVAIEEARDAIKDAEVSSFSTSSLPMAASASEGSEALLGQQSEDGWEDLAFGQRENINLAATGDSMAEVPIHTSKQAEADLDAVDGDGNQQSATPSDQTARHELDLFGGDEVDVASDRMGPDSSHTSDSTIDINDPAVMDSLFPPAGNPAVIDAVINGGEVAPAAAQEVARNLDRLRHARTAAIGIDGDGELFQTVGSPSTPEALCPECKILMRSKRKLIAGMEEWYSDCRNFPKCKVTFTTTEAQAQNQARVTEVSTGQSSRLANPTARARAALSPKRVQRDPNVEEDMDSDG